VLDVMVGLLYAPAAAIAAADRLCGQTEEVQPQFGQRISISASPSEKVNFTGHAPDKHGNSRAQADSSLGFSATAPDLWEGIVFRQTAAQLGHLDFDAWRSGWQ